MSLSTIICPICENFYCSKHFDKWWNPEQFDWWDGSWALAQYCHEHFDKWWSPAKYNWLRASRALANFCLQSPYRESHDALAHG